MARTVEDPIGFSHNKRLAEEVRPKVILIIDDDAETIVLLESIGRRAASSGWEIARSSSEPSSCCSAFGTPRGPVSADDGGCRTTSARAPRGSRFSASLPGTDAIVFEIAYAVARVTKSSS
jgi:hypothetical protein